MAEKIIVAKTFLVNSDELILVIRRSDTDTRRPLTWDLPGGIVEYGEDPARAVIREAKEEAGITINGPKIINASSINDGVYIIRLVFYEKVSNSSVNLSYEHDKYKWVTKEEFRELNTQDYMKNALEFIPE